MNSRIIIFSFMLFFSLEIYCQNINETVEIPKSELREVYEMVRVYRDSLKNTQDSLKECKIYQKHKKSSFLDTSKLKNFGKYYALIIAVSDYENDRNFPDLPETFGDGEKLYKILKKKYVFERVTFLPNPTKEAITREFSGLITEAKENDNVLIFYAGHGYMWKDRKVESGYWCPANAKWEDNNTLLNDFEILGQINLMKAKNTLLISDACFAGSIGGASRSVNPPKSLVNQQIYDKQSVQYISSGSDSEVPDDSKFFKNLIEGLEQNTEKILQASDLYFKHLKNSYTRINDEVVIPQMSPLPGHELGGDFFFIKK